MLKKLIARINKQYKSLLGGFMVVLSVSIVASSVSGCKHEPLVPLVNGGNGGGGDDTTGTGIPCDTNLVYFDQQVMPIITNFCATSNCHAANNPDGNILLNNYDNVMANGEIDTFDPFDSDFWEKINESNASEMMPPDTSPQLSLAQIDLIELWLSQGAQDLHCDNNLGPCDSSIVSFANDINPIIMNKCVNCHLTATSANYFIVLNDYAGVSASAVTGQLLGSITHDPNYKAMPKGGVMLSDCELAKFRNWINDGALNN